MKYTSIVITTFISNQLRLKMFRTSMESLLETTKNLPVEIIVVDNGGYEELSLELLSLVESGEIQCYVKNATNLHFGMARNQGIAMATGDYIVIADNDIYYEKGWLEACLKPLGTYPDRKIYATPINYPTGFKEEQYNQGKLDIEGVVYNLNMRAGSNCFVIRKEDLKIIGSFMAHRIAGSKWTDKAVELGYLAAVTPINMVKDLGLRLGYNHSQVIPIKRVLRNGQEIIYNEDGFKG